MERLYKDIDLIVSEVDGIITEGMILFDELGNTLFKEFYMKDFEAINLLRTGFKFVFLSSSNSISYNLFRHKNIPFYWAQKDKVTEFRKIVQKYCVTSDRVLYVGCTFSDVECMQMCGATVCSSDSVNEVLSIVGVDMTSSMGGTGVLCDLYAMLKSEIFIRTHLDK